MPDFQLSPRQQTISIMSRLDQTSLEKIIGLIETYLSKEELPDIYQHDIPHNNTDSEHEVLTKLMVNAGFKLTEHGNALSEPIQVNDIEISTTLQAKLLQRLNTVLERLLMFSMLSQTKKDMLSIKDMQAILDSDIEGPKAELLQTEKAVVEKRAKLDAMSASMNEQQKKILAMKMQIAELRDAETREDGLVLPRPAKL